MARSEEYMYEGQLYVMSEDTGSFNVKELPEKGSEFGTSKYVLKLQPQLKVL